MNTDYKIRPIVGVKLNILLRLSKDWSTNYTDFHEFHENELIILDSFSWRLCAFARVRNE